MLSFVKIISAGQPYHPSPYASVLHDRDIQMMQDANHETLALRRADGVVVALDVYKDLETVLQTIFREWFHQPNRCK